MEAGKFYVNMGLTGVEKMAGGLEQINDHFSGLKGISTEAKLAILAALAGLEQITSFAGRFGNEITKTTQFLNIGKQALQEYEAAAQRFGAPEGAFSRTIDYIQNGMMNNIWAGKNMPEFLPTIMSMLTQAGEKFTPQELAGQSNYWEKNPLEFARHIINATHLKGVDKGRLGYILSQAGFDQDFLNVAKMGAFSERNMAIARKSVISDQDVKQLNDLNVEWKTFELTMEKLVKLFGTELVPTVEKLNKIAGVAVDLMERWRKADTVLTDKNIGAKIFGKERMKEMSVFQIRPEHRKEDTQRLFNLIFNIHGVDLKDHPALKKAIHEAVKPAIRELNRKERTGSISTATPTVSR